MHPTYTQPTQQPCTLNFSVINVRQRTEAWKLKHRITQSPPFLFLSWLLQQRNSKTAEAPRWHQLTFLKIIAVTFFSFYTFKIKVRNSLATSKLTFCDLSPSLVVSPVASILFRWFHLLLRWLHLLSSQCLNVASSSGSHSDGKNKDERCKAAGWVGCGLGAHII